MSKDYPNSGALFYQKNRVHPNSPDMTGDLSVDRSLLRKMLDETDEDEITFKLSAWEKQGRNGPFFSIKVNTYKRLDEQQAPRPAASSDPEDLPF